MSLFNPNPAPCESIVRFYQQFCMEPTRSIGFTGRAFVWQVEEKGFPFLISCENRGFLEIGSKITERKIVSLRFRGFPLVNLQTGDTVVESGKGKYEFTLPKPDSPKGFKNLEA